MMHNPDLTVSGESNDDRWIHDRDLVWLREADCLVAEVTTPSLVSVLKLRRRLMEPASPMSVSPERRSSALRFSCRQ